MILKKSVMAFKKIKNRFSFSFLRQQFLQLKYGFIIPPYDGMMNEAKCRFLYDVVTQFHGDKNLIVEIGSWKGCSTTWLAAAGKRQCFKKLIAIDLFTGTPSWNEKVDTYDEFIRRMKLNSLDDFVIPMRADANEAAKTWRREDTISILHIDGDHSYAAVKADMANYLPHVMTKGIVIIDDYDSLHHDVERAVDELIDTKQVETIARVKEIPQKGFGSIALKKL